MKKILVKEEVCIGCGLCEVYCQLHHAKSKDIVKAFLKEFPQAVSRVRVEKNRPVAFSVRCQHCEDAPCVSACLTGALHRDSGTGLVTVDEEKCMGCWTCVLNCPYGALKRDVPQKRVAKCDLCQGEEIPVCVANCPNEALVVWEDCEPAVAVQA